MAGAPAIVLWEYIYMLSIQEHEHKKEVGSFLLISWSALLILSVKLAFSCNERKPNSAVHFSHVF